MSERARNAGQVSSAMLGGGAAQLAYQQTGWKLSRDGDARRKAHLKTSNGAEKQRIHGIMREHKHAYGGPSELNFWRKYPTNQPTGKLVRSLSYTHGGKTGLGVATGTAALGAAAGVKAYNKVSKKSNRKGKLKYVGAGAATGAAIGAGSGMWAGAANHMKMKPSALIGAGVLGTTGAVLSAQDKRVAKSRKFDPERKRQNRLNTYIIGGGLGSMGAAGETVRRARKAGSEYEGGAKGQLKPISAQLKATARSLRGREFGHAATNAKYTAEHLVGAERALLKPNHGRKAALAAVALGALSAGSAAHKFSEKGKPWGEYKVYGQRPPKKKMKAVSLKSTRTTARLKKLGNKSIGVQGNNSDNYSQAMVDSYSRNSK